MSDRRFATRAAQAGLRADLGTGAVVPPIHPSTTFERDPDGDYPRGYVYGRQGNPNRDALEETLADLEGGAAAVAFASGLAACAAVLRALPPGAHVVLPQDVYHGLRALVARRLAPAGLQASAADLTRAGALEAALRPNTRLVWVETPSNPLLGITDLERTCAVAHAAGARICVDNTWATPALQRPLEHGADLVVHSTTKYLNGHGDVTGGVVVGSKPLVEALRAEQVLGGAVPSPFDCWLTLRGLRTLAVRMRAHCEGAEAVADFLAAHPRVKAVLFPGRPDHPGHAVAARQMSAFGGMLSVRLRGDAMAVAGRLRIFRRATSLGGTESLVEHRASIEGPGTQTPDDLLRLSIGLEAPADLVADLDAALATRARVHP
ncbi:MAG: aminotransferase class V-fold PLP-dependent enzyme [Myxococcales bacterium]|nr:aminotransferase class V-fold PLP-dependent enzyme [Myxococcales bacterium]